MTITVTQAVTDALRLCGQVGAPGRGPGAEESDETLRFLNRLVDGWSAMEDKVFTVSEARYPLTPTGQLSYSIGPTNADFTAARPISIQNANLVLTTASPEVFIALQILDDDEWADVVVRDYGTSVPRMLYYNKNGTQTDNPENGRLYLVGKPTTANDLQLFTTTGFNNNLTLDDSISLPEGYLKGVIYSLAEDIHPLYARRGAVPFAQLQIMARKARAAIVALNSQAPHQGTDAPSGPNNGGRGPYFNYLSGLTR